MQIACSCHGLRKIDSGSFHVFHSIEFDILGFYTRGSNFSFYVAGSFSVIVSVGFVFGCVQ